MTKKFHTSQLGSIRLGRKMGVGGEGAVFEVENRDDLAAKIYHEPPPKEKSEKLLALTEIGGMRLRDVSAWPLDVVYSGLGDPVTGFVMKRIPGAEELHVLHSPKSRLQKFPDATWSFLIHTAADLARPVNEIHDHGLVIGDLNPKNVVVTKKATALFLDCDSFQLSKGEKIYHCEVGFPEYTPPELQGKPLREIELTLEHDSFGLAVVIFQLLFLGRHPFSGRFLGKDEMPLERAIQEYRFAYGVDAESRGMRPPLGALAIESVPASIASLFRRSFLSTSPRERPQPREWIGPLNWLTRCLKLCSLHNGHQYYNESPTCPWCALESESRTRLFNFKTDELNQTRSHFRLNEVWNAIECVTPPPPESPGLNYLTEKSKPAEGMYEYAFSAPLLGLASVFFALIVGFIIPWMTPVPISFLSLLLAGYLAMKLVEKELSDKKKEHGRVSFRAKQAAETAQRLEMKWSSEASEQRFYQKLRDLQSQKQAFESLSQIRISRLEKLMAEGRADQFNRLLASRPIESALVPELRLSIVDLACRGILSAADVTPEKLNRIPALEKACIEKLLQWRLETEQSFVFNPGENAMSRARIEVEREIDRLRSRLEDELAGGAGSLNRLKQEIEEVRRELRPTIASASRALAWARRDSAASEIVDEGYFKSRAVVLLFASFITASILERIDQGVTLNSERGCLHRGCTTPRSLTTYVPNPIDRAASIGKISTPLMEGNRAENMLILSETLRKADHIGSNFLEQSRKEFYEKEYQRLGLDRYLRDQYVRNKRFRVRQISKRQHRRY